MQINYKSYCAGKKRGEWMFSKKASLEISIRAIVIVVLAMTLLGLGLAFIKGMFGNITKLSEGTFGKIEEQLQSDLVTSNEQLVFSQTKVSIERGKSSLLGWGLKNDNINKLYYFAEFTAVKCPTATCPSTAEINDRWFTFKYWPDSSISTAPYSLGAAENQVVRVDLAIPKQTGGVETPTGLYLFDLSIYEVGGASSTGVNKYASTDIFVTVT